MRIIALMTDAFGGCGGIAHFNRHLLAALCMRPDCTELVAIPRLVPNPCEPMPAKLTYVTDGINSKVRYWATVFHAIARDPRFDVIFCGHINLIPVALLLKLRIGAPVALIIHGIDAWKPTGNPMVNALVKKVNAFIAVSDFTRKCFLDWAGVPPDKGYILPNCIEIERFGPGPKNRELLSRYRLDGKTVIMTLCRMSANERYKGVDEVLDILPDLAKEIPSIGYLVVGDGSDRQRLEQKASDLGLADRTVFTGYVPEFEKADHYRLADAFVMPGRGEGFGIVYLEAMACGIPVVGSKSDGSREALRNGELGILVAPHDRGEIKNAVLRALNEPKGLIPQGLAYFSFDEYRKRVSDIIDRVIGPGNDQIKGSTC